MRMHMTFNSIAHDAHRRLHRVSERDEDGYTWLADGACLDGMLAHVHVPVHVRLLFIVSVLC